MCDLSRSSANSGKRKLCMQCIIIKKEKKRHHINIYSNHQYFK